MTKGVLDPKAGSSFYVEDADVNMCYFLESSRSIFLLSFCLFTLN
jgi:hypothetical protein